LGKRVGVYDQDFKAVEDYDLTSRVISPAMSRKDLPAFWRRCLCIHPFMKGLGCQYSNGVWNPRHHIDISSMPEIVGDAGILINPRQSRIADAMQRALTDPAHEKLVRWSSTKQFSGNDGAGNLAIYKRCSAALY
jgi:hypothetical protein